MDGTPPATGPVHEGPLRLRAARLHVREIGTGRPVIVVHGGPDFDHAYLVPELDVLAGDHHLVYYDQRGRGRSADGIRPEDVDLDSDVTDLDDLRRRLGLDEVVVLGHSWGGVLATEYAVRHPDRVSHLVLMSTAPLSGAESRVLGDLIWSARPAEVVAAMESLVASAEYAAGEPRCERDYYRLHFRGALRTPEQVGLVVSRLFAHSTREGVLTARAIEQRLYEQTWRRDGYDLVPALGALGIPTLVLHGEHDFIPVEMAARVSASSPDARLVVLPGCGHFAYLERPELLRDAVSAFLGG